MIVAMGVIAWDATVVRGYNIAEATNYNFPVPWRYEITFTNIYYEPWNYIALVTPGPGATGCDVSYTDGHLLVYLYDSSGQNIWTWFSFVVLEVP